MRGLAGSHVRDGVPVPPIHARKDVDRRDKPLDKPGNDDGEVVRSERDVL